MITPLANRPLLTILLGAAALHLVLATTIFISGRLGLMPSQFDTQGIGTFAHDGQVYLPELRALAGTLRNDGVRAWFRRPSVLHLRLYSLPVALAAGRLEISILIVEPVNLLYYLATLILVFKLCRELFDQRAALIATAITGLWPSLLLHYTQLLKDPLLITAVLVVMLVLCKSLTTLFSWRRAAAAALAAIAAVLVIWIVRTSMSDLILAIVVASLVLLVIRQIRERRMLPGNTVSIVLVLAAVLLTSVFAGSLKSQRTIPGRPLPGDTLSENLSIEDRIALQRDLFNGRDDDGQVSGSTIDTARRFQRKSDMIWYLPRATEIGLFAPFADMWLGRGVKVDATGRRLAGFEMLITYVLELLAVAGLWHRRRQLQTWLLAISFMLGVIGLGLIVRNIGTLYRLRYPFWILLVVLGAGGAVHIFSKLFAGKRRTEQAVAV